MLDVCTMPVQLLSRPGFSWQLRFSLLTFGMCLTNDYVIIITRIISMNVLKSIPQTGKIV